MTETRLPQEFGDLEGFAEKWCKPTEDDRWDERLASDMDEIHAFYNAFEPRAEGAITYCDKFPLDEMPEDAKNLLLMLCSLAEVSFPVECWSQVRVPDTGAAKVNCVVQPLL